MIARVENDRAGQQVEAFQGVEQPTESLIKSLDHAIVAGDVLMGRAS